MWRRFGGKVSTYFWSFIKKNLPTPYVCFSITIILTVLVCACMSVCAFHFREIRLVINSLFLLCIFYYGYSLLSFDKHIDSVTITWTNYVIYILKISIKNFLSEIFQTPPSSEATAVITVALNFL